METKICQNCKTEFRIELIDFEFYEKIQVPPPTFCPACRLQRRLATQNQRMLYRRTCDLCSKSVLTMYKEGMPFPVYCVQCWESDKWDPYEYGVAYDFGKPFFQQMRELQDRVPRRALVILPQTFVNSDYNNMAHQLRDCYLLFNSDMNENCMYGSEIEHSKDCIDLTMSENSQLSYESVDTMHSSKIFYSLDCEKSHDIWFSKDMVNCSDCVGCVNLRNKQYCIFNKQYTKEQYEVEVKKLGIGAYSENQKLQRKFAEFTLKYPSRYMHGRHNVDSTGDYINHSKNTKDSFVTLEGENCRFCMWLIVKPNKDCYDYTQFGENSERVYETLTSGLGISDLKFSMYCTNELTRLTYCDNVLQGSSDLFGCVSLKKAEYCILNRRYTKGEYEALVPRVIEHMNTMPYEGKNGRVYKYGEYFPIELSLYDYNETDAQEYFPLTEEQALAQGLRWKKVETKAYEATMSWDDLPNDIRDVPDSIVNEMILCKSWSDDSVHAQGHNCTKVFKLLPRELEFYRSNSLPLPRHCPNSRHILRVARRNLPRYYTRECQCAGIASSNSTYQNTASHQHHEGAVCSNEFQTSYAPDRPEIIYCEQCYQAEVV